MKLDPNRATAIDPARDHGAIRRQPVRRLDQPARNARAVTPSRPGQTGANQCSRSPVRCRHAAAAAVHQMRQQRAASDWDLQLGAHRPEAFRIRCAAAVASGPILL